MEIDGEKENQESITKIISGKRITEPTPLTETENINENSPKEPNQITKNPSNSHTEDQKMVTNANPEEEGFTL
ncbi:11311_t:CDS:2, partial [Cetraspora pellucida]